MEETYLLNYPGVRKKILVGGSGPLPHFPPGTKLVFHFQTLLDNFERTVIDDSRLAGRPAEIFVGKMFKMEVWETLLTSMRVGEVAEFWCDAIHTGLYPIVSKGMRLIAQGKDPLEGQRHMCGMGNLFHYHSTGFPELDELMRTPQPLIFIMELLQVGDPMSYHRESWMMEKDEKLQTVPVLHMQGNALVQQKKYRDAASKYKEAVLLLKTVQSREMPGDIDYINLGRMIVPLELNYCQCMLELEEYYEVIEHMDELLQKHKVSRCLHEFLSATRLLIHPFNPFAIEYVDCLQNKVDQQGEDWDSLEKVRLPLTLNFSQCMLELKQYQQVVELNTKLLKKHKGNFKAVYQRARAHAALCNEDEARRDFDMVEKLDQKFKPFVQQELRKLGQSMRSMHASQNKTYWDTTQEKWGPGGTKPTSAARKKNVKFPPKATEGKAKADINVDKKTEDTKSQEMESSEKCTPVETEGVDVAETGKNPDVKAEQGNKEPERGRASGEGLDNESIEKAVVHEAGLGVPDNQAIDKDRDPAPASSGKDNAASKRSVRDKARKKVKCQSSAAPQPKRTNSGNKANRAKTEKGGTASE
ncbi:aryl-hydrocarbon-interacting protein-like 1 [Pundamilia nyererei]|uniref:Aryl-hydrocarbon-interacting protein-like 1 n=1 Tax=Pundamilia nyererei TaxID=303518 RepID=A0A9Y6MCA0_9CICH|nr:PREDICTED: aryl-hydrocarbon-interacting protein-like 1 [Pundamilia nyererei]